MITKLHHKRFLEFRNEKLALNARVGSVVREVKSLQIFPKFTENEKSRSYSIVYSYYAILYDAGRQKLLQNAGATETAGKQVTNRKNIHSFKRSFCITVAKPEFVVLSPSAHAIFLIHSRSVWYRQECKLIIISFWKHLKVNAQKSTPFHPRESKT